MYLCQTELFSIEKIIYIKLDSALNNLRRLICHKTKQTKPNQTKPWTDFHTKNWLHSEQKIGLGSSTFFISEFLHLWMYRRNWSSFLNFCYILHTQNMSLYFKPTITSILYATIFTISIKHIYALNNIRFVYKKKKLISLFQHNFSLKLRK